MKIVLIQPDTLIGEALENLIPRETNAQLCRINIAQPPTYNEEWEYTLDFSDRKLFRKTILSEKPDIIINPYIITNNKDNLTKEQIWNINVDLNDFLITTAKIADIHYITFSSELVFDGKRGPYSEDDLVCPTDYLSKSLVARENSCKQDLNQITLFRTTKVFGYSSYDNLDEVSEIYVYLQTGIDVEVQNTVLSNPVWNNDVARAVINAFERKKFGLYNLGGADFLTEEDKVNLISKVFGISDVDINAENVPEIKKLGLINLKAQTDLRIDFTKYENALLVIKYNMDTNFRIMSI
ncbi:MAG: sugar nucleotide-binding protein [Ignavibacteria bacterium]|nr:sugar nucleotide-binding protein [Ignavibacteria bacterium]